MTAKLFQLNIFVLVLNWNVTVEQNRIVNAIYSWLFQTPLPLIRLISCVHVVGTLRIGIAETVAQTTLCDFQLDTILQPHCLPISVLSWCCTHQLLNIYLKYI